MDIHAGSEQWGQQPDGGLPDIEVVRILHAVAAVRGVKRGLLDSPFRGGRQISLARQLAMYLVHTLLSRTYHEVGEIFGRDRTTVSYACARIEDLREDRTPFARDVDAIEAAISQAREREARRGAC